MKSWIPLLTAVLCTLWVGSKFRLPAPEKSQHGQATRLASLPVVWQGRLQPLDSVARNALLQIREKQSLYVSAWKGQAGRKAETIPASAWILEMFFAPERADTYPIFRIDNESVKGLLHLPLDKDEATNQDGKHYSWNQISPHLFDLLSEATRASRVEKDLRNAYENAVIDAWDAASLYRQLKATVGPAGSSEELPVAMRNWRIKFEEARIAFEARQRGEDANEKALDWLNEQMNSPLLLQPEKPEGEWLRVAMHLRNLPESDPPHPLITTLHKAGEAYRADDKAAFAAAVDEAHAWSEAHPVYLHADDQEDKDPPRSPLAHALSEVKFNTAEPFYQGMVLSVVAFLFLIASWFSAERLEWSRRTGTAILWVVFGVLTFGICWRMFHEERPPVTNLYSSALLIGWGVVLAGLILEKVYPRAIGAVVAAMATFASLIVAHYLARSGDTMVMLQAVLDTTFWLATHVVIVTLGYAGTFVAGFFGLVYVVISYFDRDEDQSKMLGAMAFGVVCFSVLFSFVGTVLGGLWADQSWGRFWGWDPKENGALLIVLWNALILHARLGGMVKQHGFLKLCIVGNIVTAWSWFGTNMLDIGLHSYGRMDAAYYALIAFCGVNLIVALLGRRWQKPVGDEPELPGPPHGTSGSATVPAQ